MMLWRLILVGAALARSDARRDCPRDKLEALKSAFQEGDYSFLSDVEAVRGFLDAGWDTNQRWGERGGTILHFTAQ
jgi:hypothetical protein